MAPVEGNRPTGRRARGGGGGSTVSSRPRKREAAELLVAMLPSLGVSFKPAPHDDAASEDGCARNSGKRASLLPPLVAALLGLVQEAGHWRSALTEALRRNL